MTEWTTVLRPGFLGKQKQTKYEEWNSLYGVGKWRLIWEYNRKFLDFQQACLVYEEGYYQYLKSNPQILNELVSAAQNVYDDAPSNVLSGVDYNYQETDRTHIQDISIRRVLQRLGRKFEGTELLQIRHEKGGHPLSMTLSPGKVPFHAPEFIITPMLEGWWDPYSVECFYQSNRVLQIFK